MIKKIADILSKYKNESWYLDIALNIENNINDIIKQLKNVKENLSHKILDINLSDEIQDDNEINDIQNDIKNIKQLIVNFTEIKQNIIDAKNNQLIFENRYTIFIIDDNLCPECNTKLFPLCIDYQKIIDGSIEDYETIEGYKCQCCKKLFAMQYDIKRIDFTNTNITLDFKYHKKKINRAINFY